MFLIYFKSHMIMLFSRYMADLLCFSRKSNKLRFHFDVWTWMKSSLRMQEIAEVLDFKISLKPPPPPPPNERISASVNTHS